LNCFATSSALNISGNLPIGNYLVCFVAFYNELFQSQIRKFRKNRQNVPKNRLFGPAGDCIFQCETLPFSDGKVG